jgi:hypothetical protein
MTSESVFNVSGPYVESENHDIKPMGQKIIKEYVMKLFDHAPASPSIEEEPVKPVQQRWIILESNFHFFSLLLPVSVVVKTSLTPFWVG